MSDNNINTAIANSQSANPDTENQHSNSQSKLTVDYLLNCIEALKADTAFFEKAIQELGSIRSEGPGDVANQARALALGDAIKAHETTNQRLLTFYEKMYDDLCGKKSKQETKQDMIMTIVTTAISEGSDLDDINALIATLQAF